MIDENKLRQWGKQVIKTEQKGLDELYQYVDTPAFAKACQSILACQGKVIVMGMGKSGHIASKIAATLASTGTPAFFVHPGEACHGDLGMLSANDLILAISYSGESSEILTLFPPIKRLGLPIISITGKQQSTMARLSQLHLYLGDIEEACPMGLAPTTSSTATLVLGDALAVALLQAKGFTQDDFALSHPGGSLGRKLLIRVQDIMHQGANLPVVSQDICITEALYEITRKRLGMTAVVDEQQKLTGIFTDGDLRRVVDGHINLRKTKISEVMTTNCVSIKDNILAAEALKIMEEKGINGLLLVDEESRPIGALNMLDMLKTGVI